MDEEARQAMLRFRSEHPLAFEVMGIVWLVIVLAVPITVLLLAIT